MTPEEAHVPAVGAWENDEARYQALDGIEPASPEAPETLVRALHDSSWRVRRKAAEKLSELPRPGEISERLLDVLANREHPGARNAAADALARIGDPALASLLRLLDKGEADRRKFAVEILGQIGSRAAERPLIVALSDPDPNVRVAAAEALGRVASDEGASALEGLLGSEDQLLKLSALTSLTELSRAPPLPVLVSMLEAPHLRRAAYRALGLVPHASAVDLLCRGLVDAARPVREAALAGLTLMRDRLVADERPELERKVRLSLRRAGEADLWLEAALLSENAEVRRGALWAASALQHASLVPAMAEVAREPALLPEVVSALTRMGPPAGPALLETIREQTGAPREAMGEALVRLATPALASGLSELADSGELDLELLAVRALGRTQAFEAATPLIKALASPSLSRASAKSLVSLGQSFRSQVLERLRNVVGGKATPAAIFALAHVGAEASLPELQKSIRDPDPQVRAATAEAACEIGGEGSLELARLALADEVPQVRMAAARGLGKLGDLRAVKLLELALGDEETQVQAAAIDAVGDLGATELVPALSSLAGSPDSPRACRAIRTLARLGALSADVLRAGVGHADPEVVKEALTDGASLPECVPLARAQLQSTRWDVRVAAARALAISGGRAELSDVRAALERETDALAKEALADASDRLSRR